MKPTTEHGKMLTGMGLAVDRPDTCALCGQKIAPKFAGKTGYACGACVDQIRQAEEGES